MCNSNVPSVSLATAVLMQVQEFVAAGKQFSRYDITKTLREKCNNGLLEIPEIEDPSGTPRYYIPKQSVDDIFEQLWRNCLANGLPSLTATYNPSAGYRVFSVDPSANTNTPAVVPSQMSPPSTPPSLPPPKHYNINLPNGQPFPANSRIPDSEINRRIKQYMQYCANAGIAATVKRIQSAIKRGNKSTGLTKVELTNILMSLGYKVV